MLHFRVSYTFSLRVEKAVQQPWRVFVTLPILEIIKQDNRSGTMCQRPSRARKNKGQVSISQDLLKIFSNPKTKGAHSIFQVQFLNF